MDLVQVGLRIKRLRKQCNLTQEKLAELTSVTPHYIYEIEKGMKTMSIYTLNDIVVNLDTSVDYVLYGTSTPAQSAYPDHLELLVESVPYSKREALADIIDAILPHLK